MPGVTPWAWWKSRTSAIEPSYVARSAPAELGRDVAQDRLDRVRVVIHTELVRHGQEKRVGNIDRGVFLQLPDELLGLRRVGPAADGAGVLVDVADLVALVLRRAEVGAIAVVGDREDAAADRDPRFALMPGLLPGCPIRVDLPALLDVKWLAALVEHE